MVPAFTALLCLENDASFRSQPSEIQSLMCALRCVFKNKGNGHRKENLKTGTIKRII